MLLRLIKNVELRFVVLSQFADFLGGLLLIKLLSNFLTKTEYGYYALTMSLLALVSVLPFSVFDQGVSRFVSIYQKEKVFPQKYINILLIYLSILILYGLIFTYAGLFVVHDNLWQQILLVLPLLFFFETVKTTILVVENANRNRKIIACSKLFDFIIKNLLILLAYYWGILDIKRLILILAIVSAINVLFFTWRNRGLLKPFNITLEGVRLAFKDIWLFSYPLLIWSVFSWCQNMSNRWYINNYMDESSVAEFSLVSSLAMVPPNLVLGVIAGFVIPIIYEKENNQPGYARATVKRVLYGTSALYITILLLSMLLNREILTLFTSRSYMESAWMLPYMLGATAFYALSTISTYEIYAHNKTHKLILPNVVPGIFSVIFGYFAVKNYKLNGALVNFILTYILCGAFIMYQTWKYQKDCHLNRDYS